MNKKITKSGKTFFPNTMRMVNFSNRLKEESIMWRKYDKIKKRKLDESDDEVLSEDNLAYENRHFKDRDESMSSVNNSMKMDISMQESNNLSNLRHLNESDVKLKKKLKTPKKSSLLSCRRSPRGSTSKTSSKKSSAKSKSNDEDDEYTSDSASSSDDSEPESEREECMVDNSFSCSSDDRLIKTSKPSKTAGEKKIKLREKLFKKQLGKLKKKDSKKSKKSKKKKSKKHKKSSS